jgi:hypothetical protein
VKLVKRPSRLFGNSVTALVTSEKLRQMLQRNPGYQTKVQKKTEKILSLKKGPTEESL